MKKQKILLALLGIALLQTTSLFAQSNAERVYSSQLNSAVIAAYETERTPVLLQSWLASTDAAERRGIALELASFSSWSEADDYRINSLGLRTKTFSSEEIRAVQLARDIVFYQKLGEADNLADAQAELRLLREKIAAQK